VILLRFYARADHVVAVPGNEDPVGRRDGRSTKSGQNIGYYLPRDDHVVVQPRATQALITACQAGQLWPADEQTARACGVEFVSLVYAEVTPEVEANDDSARVPPVYAWRAFT